MRFSSIIQFWHFCEDVYFLAWWDMLCEMCIISQSGLLPELLLSLVSLVYQEEMTQTYWYVA